MPYANRKRWRYWLKDEREKLPEEWPAPGERRRAAADGAEYELRVRLVELDPLDQLMTFQIHAAMWRDGELVAEEEHQAEG